MHVSLIPETIFHIGSFSITNTLLMSWLAMAVLIILTLLIRRSGKKNGKLYHAGEMVVDALLNFMTTIAGSRDTAKKFFPLVATVFFFVLTANWLGILPGVGSIGLYEIHDGEKTFVPLFRSVNSDLNMTLALALIVVTLSHAAGFAIIGAKAHLHKFIRFDGPINFFVGLLESISEIAKIISFSFRLFGNVFAGEVLLVIITFLIPYLIPVPFLGLELFVGLIQALIFAVLAMMFMAAASKKEAH